MHKTTKIIITLESVALAFLVAATVIAIVKGNWFHAVCNIIWIAVASVMIYQAISNDKNFREKEKLRKENFGLHETISKLKCDNGYMKHLLERKDANEETIRGYKDKFIELTQQMNKQHGASKEIRIKPYYHTYSVEIDF